MIGRRSARFFLALGLVLGVASPLSAVRAAESDAPWPEIRALLFGEREIKDGTGVIALEAPERAHDAAIVPVRIEALMPQTQERHIKAITLIIDQNPAPIAGTFHMTPESGVASIATRVRVNAYTGIRAIAETSDGALYMASRFVKASGGCSAPALKDHEQAMARLGKMKLNHTPFRLGEPNEVQLLISHPNYTGLQIDQLTRNWIPPHYVQQVEVRYNGEPVLSVDGDISISENPSIHFSFVPERAGTLEVEAKDSEGEVFTRSWPIAPGAES